MGRLLFATGGTGGHIYPAIAVARLALEHGHEVVFLGAEDGMEARLVPEAGLAFRGVSAGKWRRGSPGLGEAWRALRGVMDGLVTVRRERPDIVLGFGGFASFPGVVAAWILGVPYVLVEGNALPGRVTRWFARRARSVAVAFGDTERHLPRAHVVVTGWPVRPEHVPKADARRALGLPLETTLTVVMGGSQGSVALNELVPGVFADLERATAVLHQTGERWHDAVRASLPSQPAFSAYRTAPYLDATLAWSAADLAITRAGISTISEAAHHGVPLIAVPLPSSADDHQRHNARAVAEAGAGACVEQDDPDALRSAWTALLEPEARARAAERARERSAPNAAAEVLRLAEAEFPSPASPRTTDPSTPAGRGDPT